MASAIESKPGRSEVVEDFEEQMRIAEVVRQKFADEAPKRHLKPSRSDISSHPEEDPYDGPIPEHLKLQSLVQGSSQIIVRDYDSDAPDDFVETEYYKDLYAVDKNLHHTTGTGFIQVENNVVENYNSLPDGPVVRTSEVLDSKYSGGEALEEFVETEYYKDLNAVDKTLHHTTGSGFIQVEKNDDLNFNFSPAGLARTKSSCNPATNDWIPAADALDSVASDKPHRSEP